MQIAQITRITDLAENECAYPEPGTAYGLRRIDQSTTITDVEFVVRRGNLLIAKGINGGEFPVSGTGQYVMAPRHDRAMR